MIDNPLLTQAPPIHAVIFPVRVETRTEADGAELHLVVDARGSPICHGRDLIQLQRAAQIMNDAVMELSCDGANRQRGINEQGPSRFAHSVAGGADGRRPGGAGVDRSGGGVAG